MIVSRRRIHTRLTSALLGSSLFVLGCSGTPSREPAAAASTTPTATSPTPAPSPATPDAPALRSVDVEVGSAPYLLKGTLTLPAGDGPFAATILIHGSGPNDRDGSVGANKPLKDLAEGLAAYGVATLRYDKRTYAHKLTNNITLDEEVVLDAIAAVQLLKSRREVDPQRIFVAGHSLGALLAPEVAVRSAPVAGVVLLAPPGRAPWDSVLAQLRYLEAPANMIADAEQAVAQIKAGKPDASLLGVPAAYWRDWASRDGVAMAKQLARPILILRGDRDYQVTDEDLDAWRRGLQGYPRVTFSIIAGANHLFIKGTGKPGPAEYYAPGHVEPAVIVQLAAFMSATPALAPVTR